MLSNSTKTDYGILLKDWRLHVLYWTGLVIFWMLIGFLADGEIWEAFVNKLGYLPSQMLVTYVALYVVLPRLYKRQYLKSALVVLPTLYLATTLARGMKIYFYEPLLGYDSPQESLIEILTQRNALLVQYFIWVMMIPVMTIIAVLIYQHYLQQKRLADLKARRSQSELGFLQSQLHPHFLFNTLNNLYTLSLQGSSQTTDVARRLRSLLNYMFEKKDQHLIALSEEMSLVYDYIQLEKLRYGDRLLMTINEKIEHGDFRVIPFMILSLVENAFKHGVSKNTDQPTILIDLVQQGERMQLNLKNSMPTSSTKDEGGYTKGIGIKNIKRQLELIFPSSHTYRAQVKGDLYSVELSIGRPEMESHKLALLAV